VKEIISRLSVKPFSVVGHRGAAGERPENTIAAFEYAINLGVDVVECDVRETADGELVVIHDDNLKRVAGLDRRISELSLSEIKEIKIDGEKIPTIGEVLEVVNGRCGLFIEIKEPSTTGKLIEKVKSQVKNTDWIGFISFYEEALKEVKETDSNLVTGLIYSKPPGKILEARTLDCSFVLPKWYLSTEKAVKFAHRMRLKVVSWVINDERSLNRVLNSGCDALATDLPSWLLKVRKELL